MRRYALRDDQWERIETLLPGREGHVGGTAADNRLFVQAGLYRYRAGIPWRDLPERFGDWKRFLDIALPGLADDRPNGDESRMQPHERPGEPHNGDPPKRPLSWWLILIIFALF